MEYWIIVDKRHAGPYTAEQLVNAGLRDDTLVWCEGLAEWTPATQIAELAAMMRMRDNTAAEDRPAETEATEPAEQPQAETQPATHTAAPEPPRQPQPEYRQQAYEPRQQAPAAYVTPDEPCPPAYIAWSVIATLMCCTIVGIPAIIFSSMTKSAWYRGDIAKAKRYSELAQWFIILAITLGVVCWPFQLAFMGAF